MAVVGGVGMKIEVLFLKSRTFTGWLVRTLVMFRSGIPFKHCWSHVALRFSGDDGFSTIHSAEPKGIVSLKPNAFDAPKYGLMAVDVTGIVGGEYSHTCLMSSMLLGTPYAFARYIMDTLLILNLFMISGGVILSVLGRFDLAAWCGFGLFVSQVIRLLCVRPDRKSMDCSEHVSHVLAQDLWGTAYFSILRAMSPNELHSVIMALAHARVK